MSYLRKLLDPARIRRETPNYRDMRVRLRKHPQKGTSLFAARPIKKGQVIAYYKIKVYNQATHRSIKRGMYTFTVYTKSGRPSQSLIGDLYSGSIPEPKGDIPFWGPFANEPSGIQKGNATIDINLKGNYWRRNRIRAGDTMVYKLIAERNIKKDEEIVWCYGDSYIRNYVPNC